MKKKIAVSAIALVLVLCCAIGGTLAWLADSTQTITNTFTVGNVDITLTEKGTETSGESFKMVPGSTIDKDPKVKVEANSEACYLFVEVKESSNLDTYINYEVNDGWTALTGVDNVYYREVSAETAAEGATYSIIGYMKDGEFVDDTVLVNNITNTDMDTAATNPPTLTFTAYAVQKEGFDDPIVAWAEAQKATPYEPATEVQP